MLNEDKSDHLVDNSANVKRKDTISKMIDQVNEITKKDYEIDN